jgi:hypothetical protein
VSTTAGAGFDFGPDAPRGSSAAKALETDDNQAEKNHLATAGLPSPAPVAAMATTTVEDPRGSHFSQAARRRSELQERKPLLTTGADLLNGTTTPVEMPQPFTVGMSVRHPRLGVGSVIEAQGLGKWRTVTVMFSSGETQSFVAHKCPLQPVGVR